MLPQDVRAVANRVLMLASAADHEVTNLSINKIVYFLHSAFLHRFGKGLVEAKIEAWQHGPVFRELYHQFKSFDRGSISSYALKLNMQTGKREPIFPDLGVEYEEFFDETCRGLFRFSAGRLVDMSHISDGPWDRARHKHGRLNPGVAITDEAILESGRNELRH